MRGSQTTPDVASSDDDGQLNPKLFHLGDLLGKFLTICGEMLSRLPFREARPQF
jgi:hypothetical protein